MRSLIERMAELGYPLTVWLSESVVLRWYLIHTKPAAEAVAQANLDRQGFEVYFPRLQQPTLRRARWKDAIVALFPRYLFLRLNEGQQALGPVRSTTGVASVVRFGANYAVVPDQVIRELRARADPESGFHKLSSRLPFRRGTAVRIAVGPFSGLEGLFEREAGEDRVVVLLNILGRDAAVRLAAGFVVPHPAV
jgi:transcriptional antiterminator RfaH